MSESVIDTNALAPPDATGLAGQPHQVVERGGVRYTLLGTAHVSRASVDAVLAAIGSEAYDAVAVELDPQRLQALNDPDALARLDLVKVIREGKVALFAANLGLAAYQRRLAEQLGIEPGAELKAAANAATERNLPLHLIDREVGLTLKRVASGLGFFGRVKLGTGLAMSLFASEEVGEEEIENLKHGDMLESSFREFAMQSPALYAALIDERDQYMAARLRQIPQPGEGDAGAAAPREVLAVVGAGHLQGLASHLANDQREPAEVCEALERVKQKRQVPWFTLGFTTLILFGIAWGFWNGGLALGADLLMQWVLFTAGLAAIGAATAGAHPLSILAGAVAAPLKPFRPGIPSGMFSALVEVQLRKPAYGDFLALRDDAQTLRGWYRNRVSRIVLVFILTNLGTAIGTWTAGARIFGRLVS